MDQILTAKNEEKKFIQLINNSNYEHALKLLNG